jgi:hypothetical protein
MIQGFFLYGIHMGSDQFSIDVRKKIALSVLSYAADAELSWNDLAAMTAQVADQPLPIQRAVEHGLFKHMPYPFTS